MYLNNGGSYWNGSGNHCSWDEVECNDTFEIEALRVSSDNLSGSFPTDLSSLGQLHTLQIQGNSMTGTIPDDVCTSSIAGSINITADAMNCPNDFDTSSGLYLAGCCDSVLVNVDIYLSTFASTVLRDSNCANLAGTESSVCDYMSNKVNHDIFTSGYPTDFAGDVWSWLKVRRRGHAGIVIDVLAACV